MLGYGLAALSKPLFPLAASVPLVLGARFMDRVGKGIRGAPRDALIADVTPEGARGAAYGLRQALDTVGAMLGPLAAIALMLALANDVRSVLWWAVVPAVLAVVVLVVFVKRTGASRGAVAAAGLQILSPNWNAHLARRGRGRGANARTLLGSLPRPARARPWLRARHGPDRPGGDERGLHCDRVSRRRGGGPRPPQGPLVWGLVALIASDLVIASSASWALFFAGVVLWGLHMGLTQGLLSTLVADAAPADLRGTAFGVFHLVSGVAMLLASVIAGVLWDAYGPAWTFYAGAAFTALALLGLLAVRRSS